MGRHPAEVQPSDVSHPFFNPKDFSRSDRTVHLLLGGGLLYHSESNNEEKRPSDTDYSMAGQAQIDFRIRPSLSWNAETSFKIAGYGSDYAAVSTSLKLHTRRHTFALLLSNTQYTSAEAVVGNSGRSLSDAIIGFSITREISMKKVARLFGS